MTQLSAKQQRAIAALLSARTNDEAAQRANVSRRQLYRWLQDENFRLHLEHAEAQLVQDVTRRFSSLLDGSISELETLLHTHDLSANEKVRVIRTVLELYPRLREIASFEIRLVALEKEVENDKQKKA